MQTRVIQADNVRAALAFVALGEAPRGIVYATGFCGSGVVWAPWIGRKAAQKLLARPNEAPSAFDFRAPAPIPLYNGRPWFMPIFMVMYRIQDHVKMRRAGR